MEEMISVIVITYNQETTISRTLDSILTQKCHLPIEIVVGEDCSQDGTRHICEAYATKYPNTIRLFCNRHNKGIVDNYFDCLLQCRGRYIADCAGDDFWIDPYKLEKEVKIMEENQNVTMVITNWQYYDEQSRKTTPSRQQQHAPITPGSKLLKAMITQQYMSVFHLCTSLYRADVFRKAYEEDTRLFRHKTYVSEDMQIAFTMALHGDIAYLPDITLNYSCEGVSNISDDIKLFDFVQKTTQQIRLMADKANIDIQDFLVGRIFVLGMHAFRSHRQELFLRTKACQEEWQVPASRTNALLFFIMRHEWLWRLGLIIRRCVVNVKRLYR